MSRRFIGQPVRIKSGMAEFVGKRGTIIDTSERDGNTVMYRVKLNEPVNVAGKQVRDDLWAGRHLETIR